MNAHVKWHKGLSFIGTTDSGFRVPLDSSHQDHKGASPLELVLLGMAGCTAMDVISILEKKRQTVTNFEIRTHAVRAPEHPKVFTHITVEYIITGHNLERAAAERAVELSITKYCPAINMLNKAAEIQTKITLIEASK
ncbi:MAG: OsmC family protein [Chloroflexi bacterium]|nr:OsmC family protein [Chloroflexota bacterium]